MDSSIFLLYMFRHTMASSGDEYCMYGHNYKLRTIYKNHTKIVTRYIIIMKNINTSKELSKKA